MNAKTAFAAIDRKSLVEEGDRRGEFIGMASVFNVVDLHNDIVAPGAFAESIKQTNGRTKLLYQHNPNRPIGIGEVVETDAGLMIKGRLSLGTRDAQEAYTLMLDGVLDGLSIGYDTVRSDKPKNGIRTIREVKLFEVSVVTFPANVLATIAAIKAAADGKDGEADPVLAVNRLAEEIKAGRVLSAQNLALLKNAVEALGALLKAGEPAESEEDTEKSKKSEGETEGKEGKSETADEGKSASVHVDSELLQSLRSLAKDAAALAARK